jgi:hypothetical protein
MCTLKYIQNVQGNYAIITRTNLPAKKKQGVGEKMAVTFFPSQKRGKIPGKKQAKKKKGKKKASQQKRKSKKGQKKTTKEKKRKKGGKLQKVSRGTHKLYVINQFNLYKHILVCTS